MTNGISVKVCGITQADHGESALALGADFLGINVYNKSPRCVDEPTARRLCNTFPPGQRVCVTVNPGTDELDHLTDFGFDKFQIHCDLEASLLSVAAWSGIVGRENLWLAPRIPPGEAFPQSILEFCDTILIDAFHRDVYGGTGKTADWQRFADFATLYAHKQFILAGGLNPENIVEAIASTGTDFVDVNSGVESEPGVKNENKLAALFENIRNHRKA